MLSSSRLPVSSPSHGREGTSSSVGSSSGAALAAGVATSTAGGAPQTASTPTTKARRRVLERDEVIRRKVGLEMHRQQARGGRDAKLVAVAGGGEFGRAVREGKVASAFRPSPAHVMCISSSVGDVIKLMASKRCDCVLVVDRRTRTLCGIVTDKDIAYRAFTQKADYKTLPVEKIMTPHPISITVAVSATEALDLMVSRKFRHLPVITDEVEDVDDADNVIGVLDITKCVMEGLEKVEGMAKIRQHMAELQSTLSKVQDLKGAPKPTDAFHEITQALVEKTRMPTIRDILPLLDEPPRVQTRARIAEVAALMKDKRSTAVLAYDQGKMVGILTTKDLVCRVGGQSLDLNTTSIARLITPHPTCLPADTSIVEALRVMHDNRFSHAPISELKTGAVVGLINMLQLSNHIIKCLQSFELPSGESILNTMFFASTTPTPSATTATSSPQRQSAATPQPAGASLSAHAEDATQSESSSVYGAMHSTPATGMPLTGGGMVANFEDFAGSSFAGSPGKSDLASVTTAPATAYPPGGWDPCSFLYKLRDERTGKHYRFMARFDSLESVLEGVYDRLGLDHPLDHLAQSTDNMRLFYEDDEGDRVQLRSDKDLYEAVVMAQNAGWTKLPLFVVYGNDPAAASEVPAPTPAQVLAATPTKAATPTRGRPASPRDTSIDATPLLRPISTPHKQPAASTSAHDGTQAQTHPQSTWIAAGVAGVAVAAIIGFLVLRK